MKKRVYLSVSVIIVSIILLMKIFIAAGSSTGEVGNESANVTETENNESNNNIENQTNITENNSENNKTINKTRTQRKIPPIVKKIANLTEEEKENIRKTCEDKESRKERIKCRLQYIKNHKEDFIVPGEGFPEACKNVENKGLCVQLHQLSRKCYEKQGKEKNKCFKRIAGFARAKLKDEKSANRSELSRNYVVILLYSLQEKIEKSIENEKIDVNKGTDVINKIVEIKEAILSGKSKEEVRPKFKELNMLIKSLKKEIDKNV